ncbi:MAG TPA: S9 family peptidase [Gemmatimonadales bacterium]|jgi:dipeptidyl-peptidase-4|nr:S9 family peptidase [Gemmatimonadales bacterium]
MMRRLLLACVLTATLGGTVAAQRAAPAADSTLLTVDRIYAGAEFRGGSFGPLAWLGDGSAYTTLERSAETKDGRDIVRYDAQTGTRSILVPAARLIPPGDSAALDVDEYSWSADGKRLLVFTNTAQVWRTNTRGDYWVLDLQTWRLKKLGGSGPASTLMFAKFSPDGGRVGWVRYGEYNLYVEDLATGAITPLTRDGSRTTINGTFDWVYEEELGLQDGWRWSPDGQAIAYWQLDATGVRDFPLYNTTDSLYAFEIPVQYPKAGQTNSAGRVGVVSATGEGGPTRWMHVPGDPRNNYIARLEWAPAAERGAGSRELVIQHMNRLQNTMHVMLADAQTSAVRTVFTDQDSAWVEQFDELTFVNRGRDILWLSERSGWSHLYLFPRAGGAPRALTSGAFDVLGVQRVDTAGGWVYYTASPDNPTQRYLYRVSLTRRGAPQRVTPAGESGVHSYNVSPNGRYAVHTYSRFGVPSTTTLVGLPEHRTLRTLVDNAALKAKVAGLRLGATEFTQVDIGDGIKLNAYLIKPPDFDATRRYPVFFTVYGGPGSQTVIDAWGGANYLWHQMLAQKGYIVASVDNRGTGARGRAWRKIVYKQMGVIETRDQAAAARAIGRLPYVDSTRLGIWGWSYGGFMALNTITQQPDVYRMAIAVAPVTHWKYYDTIYTERYMGLPQDNAAGYDKGSPVTYAKNLRGKLLIVHGSGDDNVHYQNTEAMVNALVAANRPFQLMVYPNRTHSISGGTTRQHLFTLLTTFVEENLPATAGTRAVLP